MNPSDEIEIRLCKTWDECVECEDVQRRVWDMPDFRDVVPASFLHTAVKNGGLLVGAFERDKMVGFAFGFLGSEMYGGARRLKHTSHMLGILPHVRDRGLGGRLKWMQRAEAIKQNLDLMTWTYDPLQSVNAYLNMARLGAIARRYIENAYGEMTDALNAGLASDRFEVEWLLTHERVAARAAGLHKAKVSPYANALYQIEWSGENFPVIVGENALQGETVLVEIPADINSMKASALPLAIDWRERTRKTFENAFALGYVAVDVLRQQDTEGHIRVYYLLNRVQFSTANLRE